MITRKPLFLSIVYTNVIYKKNGTIYYEAGTDNASETHKLATDRPTPKSPKSQNGEYSSKNIRH